MKKIKNFTDETMLEIVSYFDDTLKNSDELYLRVLNPKNGLHNHLADKIVIDGSTYIYRSYKTWSDLAEKFFCTFIVSQIEDFTVVLQFVRLQIDNSFHTKTDDNFDKYGENSLFFKIEKNEEPNFIIDYINALKSVKISQKKAILNLGVNRADEFDVIQKLVDKNSFEKINFVGIDYSKSAITLAKKRFPNRNFTFYEYDINRIDELKLKKFDLLITIGTLQSSSINFKPFFMNLVQNYLNDSASLILGFPNCRWLGGDIIYGAKAPNYSYSEQSLLFKDIYFCKKYLQQKKYRVTITGKFYLFLVATPIKH